VSPTSLPPSVLYLPFLANALARLSLPLPPRSLLRAASSRDLKTSAARARSLESQHGRLRESCLCPITQEIMQDPVLASDGFCPSLLCVSPFCPACPTCQPISPSTCVCMYACACRYPVCAACGLQVRANSPRLSSLSSAPSLTPRAPLPTFPFH